MIAIYILIFILSCLILIRSGTWVVKSLTRIAQFLGWREFLVASILMAFATSLPEIFIGITAALHGQPELAFGNIIGSNIIALTLVVGLAAVLAGKLKFGGKILQRSSLYAVAIGVFPLLFLLDGKISRIDGMVLLVILAVYFHRLFLQEKKFTRILVNHFKRERIHFKLFLKDFGVFIAGIILLLLSSEGIVYSSSQLALEFNIPLIFLGLFLVAIGTSMPEIAFGIRSVTLGHQDMVLGNVIGSVVVNATLVLGLTVLIHPLEISNFSPYLVGIAFIIISSIVFLIFVRTGQEITKKEAVFLLELYALFFLFEIIYQ